jgi:outer membrane protein assembly factor BamB
MGLVPETMAQQAGLTRDWFTRVQMDGATDKVAAVSMHTRFRVEGTNQTFTYVVYEVRTEDGEAWAYSERDVGAFGRPLMDEGAKQRAEVKKQELADAGRKATVVKREIPETTLFVQTARGVIQAIDGETGRTLWARRVGRPDYPTTAAAGNERHVAALNGLTLFVVQRESGRLVWEKKIVSAPSAGPGLSTDYVFVPTVAGTIEGYKIASYLDPPWIYKSPGRVFVQPVVTPNSLAWPTEKGQLYVSRADVPTVRYRLETRAAIVTPPAYKFPMLYAASRDGYIYAVHETAGGTNWRFSVGMPVVEPPAAVGDSVYVSPDRGGMYRVNIEDGKAVWLAPGATRFVAASKDYVYALDRSRRLLAIDHRTGGLAARLATERLDVAIVNSQTDRIYLGTSSGLIQCLREHGHPKPLIHVAHVTGESGAKEGAKPAAKQPGEAAPAAEEAAPAEEAPPDADAAPPEEPDKNG